MFLHNGRPIALRLDQLVELDHGLFELLQHTLPCLCVHEVSKELLCAFALLRSLPRSAGLSPSGPKRVHIEALLLEIANGALVLSRRNDSM